MKVTVIGAGNVGATVAECVARKDMAYEVDGESFAGAFVTPDGERRLRSYGSMTYALIKSYLYLDGTQIDDAEWGARHAGRAGVDRTAMHIPVITANSMLFDISLTAG